MLGILCNLVRNDRRITYVLNHITAHDTRGSVHIF